MKKIFLLCIVVIVSCTDINTKKEQKIETTTSDSVNQVGKNVEKSTYSDFVKFWAELGNAVKNNDTNKIKQFIKIPLKILGREDSDPHFYAYESEVIKAFLFSINKGGYYDSEKDVSISNKQLLMSKLDNNSDYEPSSNKQWINDFVFIKTEKGWKLETLYMNTNEYKKE
jgi:hypothetical protein